VLESVIHDKNGLPQGEASFAQETVAAHGAFLVNFADRLGDVFGSGAVKSATLEGKGANFILYAAKQSYLSIAASADRQLGEVDSAIRAMLAPKKGA
jgi:predicted regulator of Ras-like GTPase activity (Roadblock/LC7/MglB family)